jgi:hypothetical protein
MPYLKEHCAIYQIKRTTILCSISISGGASLIEFGTWPHQQTNQRNKNFIHITYTKELKEQCTQTANKKREILRKFKIIITSQETAQTSQPGSFIIEQFSKYGNKNKERTNLLASKQLGKPRYLS